MKSQTEQLYPELKLRPALTITLAFFLRCLAESCAESKPKLRGFVDPTRGSLPGRKLASFSVCARQLAWPGRASGGAFIRPPNMCENTATRLRCVDVLTVSRWIRDDSGCLEGMRDWGTPVACCCVGLLCRPPWCGSSTADSAGRSREIWECPSLSAARCTVSGP